MVPPVGNAAFGRRVVGRSSLRRAEPRRGSQARLSRRSGRCAPDTATGPMFHRTAYNRPDVPSGRLSPAWGGLSLRLVVLERPALLSGDRLPSLEVSAPRRGPLPAWLGAIEIDPVPAGWLGPDRGRGPVPGRAGLARPSPPGPGWPVWAGRRSRPARRRQVEIMAPNGPWSPRRALRPADPGVAGPMVPGAPSERGRPRASPSGRRRGEP
jgi:hypothetical protein